MSTDLRSSAPTNVGATSMYPTMPHPSAQQQAADAMAAAHGNNFDDMPPETQHVMNNGIDDSGSETTDSELNGADEDKPDSSEPLHSLSHYFSTYTLTLFVLLITATGVLFIWSNQSDGAYVRLDVFPIINMSLPFDSASAATANTNGGGSSLSINFAPWFGSSDDDDCEYRPEHAQALSAMWEVYGDVIKSLEGIDEFDPADWEYSARIFHFSLVSSVKDFWESKAYSLAILICGFSGLWPYVKLCLLMVAWVYPLRIDHRQKLLIFLDQLGKFSFIDLFVTVFMIVSFYIRIHLATKKLGVEIDITVEPDIGLNTFVIGTLLSCIYSHVFLYMDEHWAKPDYLRHRRRVKLGKSTFQHNDKAEALLEDRVVVHSNIDTTDGGHKFEDDDWQTRKTSVTMSDARTEDSLAHWLDKGFVRDSKFHDDTHPWTDWTPFALRYVPKSYLAISIRALLLLCMVACVWGTIESLMSAPVNYDINGLAGLVVPDSHRAYTPIQIFNKMPHDTNKHASGWFLDVVMLITVVIMPIATPILALLVWWLPTNYKVHNFLVHCYLPSMAWSALDVFSVGSIAAAKELERVSKWIIDSNFAAQCGPEGSISGLTGMDCFSVKGTLLWGTWLTLATAIVTWAILIYSICEINDAQRKVERTHKQHKTDPGTWKI